MRRTAAVAAVIALVATAARADDDARSLYAGTWHGQGQFLATPYSKAGPSSDTTTCGFEAENAYLVCAQTNDTPYGHGQQLAVYTRTAGGYGFARITADGTAHSADVSVSGVEVWTTTYSVDAAPARTMAHGTERRSP